ncbi:basic proline-rich protein-like [Motacilla alba alba]|uniref:basic proline-rich protein-like n=1 Tax=Motacilla alba alba TaxID=1094192 RepID=UPI0018D4E23B|nr:basic proline-rich protein-like [Motacilla alba alba]
MPHQASRSSRSYPIPNCGRLPAGSAGGCGQGGRGARPPPRGDGPGDSDPPFPPPDGAGALPAAPRQTPASPGGEDARPRPPSPQRQPHASGLSSSRPGRQRGGALPPLPSRASAAFRSRGILGVCFLPYPAPEFLRGGRRARRNPLPQPPPPQLGCSAYLPKLRMGPNPPAGPGAAPQFPRPVHPAAPAAARTKTGRFPPPRGTPFGESGSAERAAVAPGAAGAAAVPRGAAAATPRGSGSFRPLRSDPPGRVPCAPAAGLWPRSPHAAGGRHRPRGEKFYLLLLELHFIKVKQKTFPSAGFRCVGEAAAAGAARGTEPRCPSRRDRSLPAPRAPSPAD